MLSARPSATIVLLALLATMGGAHAQEEVFGRFAGGGPAVTDCMVVTEVAGVPAPPPARRARCTDGDPACDADGRVDGSCRLHIRLCMMSVGSSRCHADVVTDAAVGPAMPALAPLAAALAAVAVPVTVPETCTAAVGIDVATRARRPGRVVLHARAGMASGHADRDRLPLVCRPAPPPSTFEMLERRVFARRCSTASCHGSGAAGGLALGPEAAYASLVGVPASNAAARAAGVLRVVPGDPPPAFSCGS
jgi:hypothetical protein